MSEMGGVDAGPLYVDVVADLTGFSRGLQEQINARVSRIKATIKADLDQRKLDAQLAEVERKQHRIAMDIAINDAKANAQIAAFAAKQRQAEITVSVSEAKAEAELARVAAKKRTVTIDATIEDAKAEAELDKIAARKRVVTIQAEADVAKAEAQIAAAAAKKRRATIDVDVDTSKVSQKLDSIGSKLQGFGTGGLGLLQFPAIAAGISMAVGALAQLSAGLFAVVAAAAPAVGILGAIPGLIAGAAQGIGSIVVGFMGIGNAVKASSAAEAAAAATSTGASAQRAAAAQRIAAAQDRISQANTSLANAEANSARQISQAQEGVQRAHEEAARGIVSAEQQVADAHTQAARDIEAAERRVSQAQRDATQAQLDLIRARADAARQLQDMNNQNVDQGFSVEEAQIGVQRAEITRTKVNANPQSTALDKQQADLDYREAVQRLKEQQLAQQRLAKDTAAANRAGVEGSAQVVAARQKVQDANQKLIEEEQNLRDTRLDAARKVAQAEADLVRARIEGARKIADAEANLANTQRTSAFSVQSARHEVLLAERALADAQANSAVQTNKQSAANTQLAKAMNALSPAGRAFVGFLRGTLMPAWQSVQKAVQEALIPPVQRGLQALMPLLGVLQTGMVRTATILGGAFERLATQYLATPIFKRDLATIMASNNRAFATLSTALIPIVRALTDITVAAGPLLQRFAQFVASGAQVAGAFISTQRASGGLSRFFQQAGDTAAQLWRIAKDLVIAIFNIGKAAYPAGRTLLSSFEGVVAKWRAWTGSMQGQNTLRDYFMKSVSTVKALGNLIHDIVIDFFKLGNNDKFAGLLDMIRTQALPAVLRLGQTLNGAFGPALIKAVTDVVNLIADLAGAGGGGGLVTFVSTLDTIVNLLDAIARNPVGGAILRMVASFAAMAAAVGLVAGPLLRVGGLLVKVGEFGSGFIKVAKGAEGAEKGIAKIGSTVATKVLPWISRLGALFLASGPWGWIILGIAAVVTGLVLAYTHFQGFHDFVNRVLHDIGAAALWLWQHAFVPAFNGIRAALGWIGPKVFDAVKIAMAAVGTAAVWLWQHAIVPAFNGIRTALGWIGPRVFDAVKTAMSAVGTAAVWLWQHAIVPAFNGIVSVVRWFWVNVTKPIFDALIGFIRGVVAPVIVWLWNSVYRPYFGLIGNLIKLWWTVVKAVFTALISFIRGPVLTVISWLWTNVFRPTFGFIGNLIKLWWTVVKAVFTALISFIRGPVWTVLQWLWNNVVKPVFNGIAGQIKQSVAIITGIIKGLTAFLRGPVATAFHWLWDNVIKPVWTGIGTTIRAVWNNVISPAFNAVKSGLSAVADAFRTGVGKIKTFWEGLKNAVTAPVRFVIDTIYNNGIRGFWNAVAGKVGLPQLGKLNIKGINASRGAVVPGYAPGVDIVNAVLSPGEGVLVPEAVSGLARHMGTSAENAIQAINASFSSRVSRPVGVGESGHRRRPTGRGRTPGWNGLPGFDIGGIFHGIGSAAGWVGNQIGTGAKAAAGFVGDKVGAAVNALKNAAAGLLSGPLHAAAGPIHDLINRVLPVSPWFMGAMRKGGNKLVDDVIDKIVGKDQAMNAAPSVGGGVNWQQLWSIVKGAFPGAQLFSSFRPNAITVSGNQSYHALGEAIDVTPSMAIFNWIASHYPKTAELIFSPAGGRQIKNGHPYYYTGAVRAEHFNHVHWALGGGGGGGGGGGPSSGSSGGNAVNKAIGKAMAAARGWVGGQWNALDRLWMGESGWNNRARNPSSGAFGIPQALPPGKMGAAAAAGDARAQIAWGLNYIKQVYGTPAAAYSKWLFRSPHWYSLGGLVEKAMSSPVEKAMSSPLIGGLAGRAASLFDSGGILNPGTSLVHNATGKPEVVFTSPQWDTLSRIVSSASSNTVVHEPSAAERMQGAQIDIHVNGAPGQDPREIAREVAVELGWLLR